ncbi:proteasome accessory factor C [Cryobacterium mesophilum]|uniref:WYL domain-containing protein n=1 Tax=Terrimesophilobacter mesophilus TaxID=433647 RepID=A0A4R8V997_9MICO|nr:WYL domain-containing protein [Terrimesophilobacter mesophilus]MBB5632002.1 proteasome accessory factor C [Terrimesophilobacter mesophilus]TFB78896.1 WYL domain-containing protein [Terrimesophilobacter mesophilus]
MADQNGQLQARDKLTFLLALVPYLMDHDRVSVEEAARQFGVGEEQIRDAVRLIAVSGIPGETATYQHDDLFDIAWDDFDDNDQIVLTNLVAIDDSPRFSGREAAALIAGLQYLSALPENADRGAVSQLMAKLSRGASGTPSAVAVEAGESDTALAIIRDAVATGRQVRFDYLNSHGIREERQVDPLRVESVDADWYLRGWCHLRKALRTFRLDRMGNLALTTEDISFRPEDVALPDTLFEGSPDDVDVTLRLAPAALPLIADYRPEVVAATDALITARIRVSNLHVVARLVSGMPGLITVAEPVEAVALVAEWASAGLRQYQD